MRLSPTRWRWWLAAALVAVGCTDEQRDGRVADVGRPDTVAADVASVDDGVALADDGPVGCPAGTCPRGEGEPCASPGESLGDDVCTVCAATGWVARDCDDGNPCTDDICHAASGCNYTHNAAPCLEDGTCDAGACVERCTEAMGCKLVNGHRMFRVLMKSGDSGGSVCARHWMHCVDAPVMYPPEAACLAFHPGAEVTQSWDGWPQAVWCSHNAGLACEGKEACHHCPWCTGPLTCNTSNSTLLEEAYVECAP